MRAEDQRDHHRGQRQHRFDREVHMPSDQGERQADRDGADEGRLLEDVEEDTRLHEIRDRRGEAGDHDDQDEPDEIVEEKLFYDLVGFMTQLNLLPKTTVKATA